MIIFMLGINNAQYLSCTLDKTNDRAVTIKCDDYIFEISKTAESCSETITYIDSSWTRIVYASDYIIHKTFDENAVVIHETTIPDHTHTTCLLLYNKVKKNMK